MRVYAIRTFIEMKVYIFTWSIVFKSHLSLFVSRFLFSCRRCPRRRRQYPFNERNHCRMWLNLFSWQQRHRYPGRKSVSWAAWGERRSAGRSTRVKDSGPIPCYTWSVLRLKWVSLLFFPTIQLLPNSNANLNFQFSFVIFNFVIFKT